MEQNQKVEKKRLPQADGNKKWTENIKKKTASWTFGKYHLMMTDRTSRFKPSL